MSKGNKKSKMFGSHRGHDIKVGLGLGLGDLVGRGGSLHGPAPAIPYVHVCVHEEGPVGVLCDRKSSIGSVNLNNVIKTPKQLCGC